MDKLKMETGNIINENIDFIESRFPNCIVEAKNENGETYKTVDFDMLKQELSSAIIDSDRERYMMTWPGKKQAILTANAPITKTLRPCQEKSSNFETTDNVYIEGDNLEVLKVMRETYLGKIKMIYIDPPYNTGNDFIYNDSFSTNLDEYLEQSDQISDDGNRLMVNNETNGRFHTNWLNMIYPRLRIAKDLLSDDGVLFISIDDNEVSNLKKVCDEIYGERNFIALLSVENNPKGRKNSKFISVSNDYCLIYARNIESSYFVENIPKSVQDLKEDENGNFVHNSGKRVLVGEQTFNKETKDLTSPKHYSVYYSASTNDIKIKKEKTIDEHDSNLESLGYKRYISHNGNNFVDNTYTQSKLIELFKAGALEFKNDKIYEKNMSTTIRLKSLLTNKSYKAIVNGKETDFSIDLKTTSAGTELKNLFGTTEPIFSAPKNTSFVKLLVTLFDDKCLTVLDFFSGSATTAHAVMEANAEDGGERKFILVQLPEDCDEKSEAYKKGFRNICDIGEERIRKSGKKIKDANPNLDIDVGFRVFKLDTSNMRETYYKPGDYSQTLLDTLDENIKPDRTPEDLLFQVMLDLGLMLDSRIEEKDINGKKVYIVGKYNDVIKPDLMCCFDSKVDNETVKQIAKMKPRYAVFRDSSMAKDSVAINFDQIFETYSPSTTRKVL